MSDQLAVGQVLELSVGEAAHGGWCVARPDPGSDLSGLVIFVRHALPGERVRAEVTQLTARLARADAVEILVAAAGRVRPPCPYAAPGGCGGCDWQHASLAAQRSLKASVIQAQLSRIAGIDWPVTVQAVPGDAGGLGWRTRVRFAVGNDGIPGLRRHRSHDIVQVTDCLIAHPLVTEAAVTRERWPGARWVDVAVSAATGERAVLPSGGSRRASQHRHLTYRAADRDWRVTAPGFWQVHPGAAEVLAQAVLTALAPRPGERAIDLFCGAGLFAGVLASAVGPDGAVTGVEREAAAVADARHNLRATPWAKVHRGDATEVLGRTGLDGVCIAVLDPPRTGADRELIEALCAGDSLRAVAYVSCDPATLARDLAVFARHGWELADLPAYDTFPMTHHVECVAALRPASG